MQNLTHRASRILRPATLLAALLTLPVITSAQVQPNPATAPADRLSESWWSDRHNSVLEAVHTHPDTQLLLIGDSIINNYDKAHPPDEDFQPLWKQFYEPRHAINLGFSGDTTANVLWRLDHGEIEGLHPKVTVVLIGTNNTGLAKQTAEQTEAGIDAVIGSIERHLPETKILLLNILPSGVSDSKTQRDQAVSRYLATCYGDNPRITYLDISSIFFAHGALNSALFYDPRLPHPGSPLHPDTNGQRMMAEAIEPTLAKLMGDAPQQTLDSMTDIDTALIPVDRLEQDSYDWYARHHAVLDLQKRLQPQVVLLGDSITHFWGGLPAGSPVHGSSSWQHVFGNLQVLNMGFGWDRTQNVLWRLRQGEFDGLHPKWAVLAIGTNNLAATSHARASTPQEIVEGISAICHEITQRSPQTHIILMAIFPRGPNPDSPFRAKIQQTNQLLKQRFGTARSITYLDIGDRLLTSDGKLPPSLMPDALHPSDAGYLIWADALIKAGIKP